MKRMLSFMVIALTLLTAGCTEDQVKEEPNEKENEQPHRVEVEDGKEENQSEEDEGQESETEQKPPLFFAENGNLFLYGLTLGDSLSKAESIWGASEMLDEEPESAYYFPEPDMTISCVDEKIVAILIGTDRNKYEEVSEVFQGDHYKDTESDDEYFLATETGQLLMYRDAAMGDYEKEWRLLMSDDNFFYYVNEGVYEKVN